MTDTATLPLTHAFDLTIQVGPPIEVGDVGGYLRRIIPIVGGELRGSGLQGRVLQAGADFQQIAPDGTAQLDARYVVELESGARIFIVNTALRTGPPELLARLARGEPVDPAALYFRCAPRFEVADPALTWLRHHVYVGTGARRPSQVELTIWQVG